MQLSAGNIAMTDPARAQEVAGRLNGAQVAMVLELPADGSWRRMVPTIRYAEYGENALRGFGKMGLIESDREARVTPAYRLTPLGLEVRRILMETQHGE